MLICPGKTLEQTETNLQFLITTIMKMVMIITVMLVFLNATFLKLGNKAGWQ